MSSIEINGRVLDAETGRPLTKLTHGAKQPASRRTTDHFSIDGVIRPSNGHKTLGLAPTKNQNDASRPAHITAKPANKHPQQKSKTLMRHALHKPLSARVGGHLLTTDPGDANTAFIAKADTARATRAEALGRHKLITKFAPTNPSLFVKKSGHLPVAHPKQPLHHPSAVSMPLGSAASENPDPLAGVIERSTSHQAPKLPAPKRPSKWAKRIGLSGLSRRGLSLSSSALAAAAIIGFFAYQNIPNIKMRLASSRADVAAGLPGHTPSGFSVGQIDASPGQIVINFRSNTNDSRSFQITQRNSNWNSEALLANYVDDKFRGDYQVRQDHGKTIYIYQTNSNSNATWVDGGIWYNIESQANLNQDQLNQMALSL